MSIIKNRSITLEPYQQKNITFTGNYIKVIQSTSIFRISGNDDSVEMETGDWIVTQNFTEFTITNLANQINYIDLKISDNGKATGNEAIKLTGSVITETKKGAGNEYFILQIQEKTKILSANPNRIFWSIQSAPMVTIGNDDILIGLGSPGIELSGGVYTETINPHAEVWAVADSNTIINVVAGYDELSDSQSVSNTLNDNIVTFNDEVVTFNGQSLEF